MCAIYENSQNKPHEFFIICNFSSLFFGLLPIAWSFTTVFVKLLYIFFDILSVYEYWVQKHKETALYAYYFRLNSSLSFSFPFTSTLAHFDMRDYCKSSYDICFYFFSLSLFSPFLRWWKWIAFQDANISCHSITKVSHFGGLSMRIDIWKISDKVNILGVKLEM